MKPRILRGDPGTVELPQQWAGKSLHEWMANDCQLLKRDSHSLVALATLSQGLSYLKFYQPKNALQRLAFRLGLGRGVQAFDNAMRLADAGIPVPTPLACLIVDGGMLLLTEGMEAAVDLKSLWQGSGAQPVSLVPAAELLAKLHLAGFSHGDCKWSNLLCGADGMSLVDLEAVTDCSPGSSAQWRDLARFTVNAEDLGVDAADYEDFLRAYCRQTDVTQAQVIANMQSPLARLRKRHRSKYGERGSQLV